MARRALLPWVLVLAACRTAAPMPGSPAPGVRVQALSLTFPEPQRALLTFLVPTRREDVTALTWEVMVDGRPFAAGIETRVVPTAEGLQVVAPLTWRYPGWSEGARYLQVHLEGQLEGSAAPQRERFEGDVEVLAAGGPAREDTLEQ